MKSFFSAIQVFAFPIFRSHLSYSVGEKISCAFALGLLCDLRLVCVFYFSVPSSSRTMLSRFEA